MLKFQIDFLDKTEKGNITMKCYIQISLGTKFCLRLTPFDFSTKLTQKGYFQSNKKNENHHWFLYIRINLGSKFQLQQTIFIFGTNFLKKVTSGWKQKKWTSPLNSSYSNYFKYQFSAWTDNFDFLDQICPKRVAISSTKQIKSTPPLNSSYLS